MLRVPIRQPGPRLFNQGMLSASIAGVLFKRVVEIGISPAEHEPRAHRQVGGDHEGPPSFVLPDVGTLVSASPVEGRSVDCQHDIAKS